MYAASFQLFDARLKGNCSESGRPGSITGAEEITEDGIIGNCQLLGIESDLE
jgi:hypothetical protein